MNMNMRDGQREARRVVYTSVNIGPNILDRLMIISQSNRL